MNNGSSQLLRNQDIEKIIEENNNLRAEIAALRGQIDAMHSRGEELKKQNNDLSETASRHVLPGALSALEDPGDQICTWSIQTFRIKYSGVIL